MTSSTATHWFFSRDLKASLAVDRFSSDSTQTLFSLRVWSSFSLQQLRPCGSLTSAAETILPPATSPRLCAWHSSRQVCVHVCVRVRTPGCLQRRRPSLLVCRWKARVEVWGEAVSINQARLQRRRDLQLPSNSRTFLCFMSPYTLTVTTVTRGSVYTGHGPVCRIRTRATESCCWCNSYLGAILYQVHLCVPSLKRCLTASRNLYLDLFGNNLKSSVFLTMDIFQTIYSKKKVINFVDLVFTV